IAWPLVVSMGSFTLMQFVDRMFLAWHSPVSIQAALPAGILSFTFICTFMALCGYANTFVAQYHGAEDPEGCSRSTAQAVWLAFLTWPILLATIPLGLWLLTISGHEPPVLAEERIYFTILTAGGVVVPLGAAISSFFTGRGETRTNMLATIAGNVVNGVLDYVLIFGKAGFPAMGIRGAAIATLIAGLVTPGILFAIYFSRRYHRVYQTRKHLGIEWRLMARLVRFGLPSGINMLMEIAAFSLFILITGRLGPLSLAISNMALSINSLAFLPLIGLGIAAATLVGQYQGRGDSETAARAARRSVMVGVYYVGTIGLTYFLFPTLYFSAFTARASEGFALEELLGTGRQLLMLMAIWGLADAVNVILAGALKGAGDTRFVLIYSSLLSWGMMVPGVLVLVLVLGGGLLGMWTWALLYVTLLAIGYAIRFRGGRWKTIAVIESPPPPPAARPGAEALAVGD
ncbi:MAG TPA: MATE family efflux transporter, partial [Kiritimatiellia bacterium]|nr:MATE family efflux transporter [Kiritimatiellia bacterium]HMP00532.1 MATE family efflux transporter [Kiritimatiellia bacterium]